MYLNVKEYTTPGLNLGYLHNPKNFDIPGIKDMTREEAERWIIEKSGECNITEFTSGAYQNRFDGIRDFTANMMTSKERGKKQVEMSTPDLLGTMPGDATTPTISTKPVIKKTKKFKLGEHYIIYPFKNKRLKREYVVKKTIYSIKDEPVNIVVMKQVKGTHLMKYTLSKTDCQKYHIKYEEGLEVYSMDLDWKLVKTNKKQ